MEESSDDIIEEALAALCKLLYYNRLISEILNSAHYQLVMNDMSDFVEQRFEVIYVGGHGTL